MHYPDYDAQLGRCASESDSGFKCLLEMGHTVPHWSHWAGTNYSWPLTPDRSELSDQELKMADKPVTVSIVQCYERGSIFLFRGESHASDAQEWADAHKRNHPSHAVMVCRPGTLTVIERKADPTLEQAKSLNRSLVATLKDPIFVMRAQALLADLEDARRVVPDYIVTTGG